VVRDAVPVKTRFPTSLSIRACGFQAHDSPRIFLTWRSSPVRRIVPKRSPSQAHEPALRRSVARTTLCQPIHLPRLNAATQNLEHSLEQAAKSAPLAVEDAVAAEQADQRR
jgi:hypothetical protein